MNAPAVAWHVRALTEADLADMERLEQLSHATPWSTGMLRTELQRGEGVRLGVDASADDADGAPALAGMLLAALLADEWHLMDIAVHPAQRRRGIGVCLLAALLDVVDRDGAACTLEVRAGNRAAIALYERAGFAAVGTRVRYYPDGEDALVMTRPPREVRA